MAVLGSVDAVFIFVTDLPAAITWYQRLVGSGPVDADSASEHPQLATFSAGRTDLIVHVADDINAVGDLSGPVVYWSTDDVDAIVEVATANGATAHRGPKTIFSEDRLVQLVDPWGNLIGVRQPAAASSTAPGL
jgi:predicted enzyme related to lactoylglutathione lyase